MDQPIKLLELGVAKGSSMQMWRDCFPKAVIAGPDLMLEWESNNPRVRIYRGAQNDTALLSKIADECAPDGFDIIVDNAAHIGEMAKISFWHLFLNHLKPGGFYAIEDWGTGYFGGYRNVYYPDGEFFDPTERETFMHWLANKMLKAAPVEWRERGRLKKCLKHYQFTRRFKGHDYGMVGFVKQLIDELGISEWTGPMGGARLSTPPAPERQSRLSHVLYSPGLVIVTKA